MLRLAFAPMALAQHSFPVGSAIRVTVSFTYTAGVNAAISLKAGPYYYPTVAGLQVGPATVVDACVGSHDINLPAASTATEVTETVDFALVPKAQGGMDDGTYGLRVWIDGTNVEASQDDVLVVTGNPAAAASTDIFSSMLPMLMMFMMMAMIMPMMQGNQE